MADYDFHTINDKDFEVLSTALLSRLLGQRIERFKPGKDKGVDGRFFSSPGKEVVVQCKHWYKSGFPKLERHLATAELPKIQALCPARYILVTSVPLSRLNKKSLMGTLQPYIKDSSDILGPEDLNDLLAQHPDLERRFFQLWLTSSNVLSSVLHNALWGRSEWHETEIRQKSARYVATSKHREALEALSDKQVIIVTGAPGVGKTTLAEQVALEVAASGYQLVSVADDITDAEQLFNRAERQVFLFDDFLGRNYLDALQRNEDTKIVNFIRRVRQDKTKRLVLTSRTSILSQGKRLSDQFLIANVNQSEFEIRVTDLTRLERAQILYNHIWFGNLEPSYVDELYVDRRYRAVIDHKNFNPRLIEFITDPKKIESVPATAYWSKIETTLNNPNDVWEGPFDSLLTEGMRLLVLLVTLHRHPVPEDVLRCGYNRLSEALPRSHPALGSLGFHDAMRLLTGSFLVRLLDQRSGAVSYDLFTPAIGDYVLGRFRTDVELLAMCFRALRTVEALQALRGMSSPSTSMDYLSSEKKEHPALFDSSNASAILVRLGRGLGSDPGEADHFDRLLAEMILADDTAFSKCGKELDTFLRLVLNGDLELAPEDLTTLFLAGLRRGVPAAEPSRITKLYLKRLSFSVPDAIPPFWELYRELPMEAQQELERPSAEAVIDCWKDSVESWVWRENILEDYLDEKDAGWAADRLEFALQRVFEAYPVEIEGAVATISECVDLGDVLADNIEARNNTMSEEPDDDEDRWRGSTGSTSTSAVDDLFDRG